MATNFNDSTVPVRLAKGHIRNLMVQWGSNTTLTITSGECRDSTDSINIVLPSSVTLNAATVGVNGMDTGALEASKDMYLFAISDTSNVNPSGSLLSLSSSSPIMPTVNGVTYDAFRLISYWKTNSSSQLIKGYTAGNENVRTHFYDTIISVLSAGTATSLANIDLSAGLPPLDNLPIRVHVDFTPATANDQVDFVTGGSTATVTTNVKGDVATKVSTSQLEILSKLISSVPTIRYKNSAGSCSANVYVSSFDYFL